MIDRCRMQSMWRFFRRGKWDRERLAEIESYVQIESDDNMARGMTPAAARAAARRKFGNSTLIREEIYAMNTVAFLDALVRDARHGMRTLLRNPLFSVVALFTIAIGNGANTAVFSVVNSVLLRPLPYPKAAELLGVWQTAPGAAGLANFTSGLRLSPSMYFTYAEQNRACQALGGWVSGTASVTGVGEPEQVRRVFVSDGTLEALNVAPVLGRWLGQSDQAVGSPETVMLSYGYWQQRFGGDRRVIGRGIRVDSRPREIVGVMPPGSRLVNVDADLIRPVRFERSKLVLAGFAYLGIARLKPGVTIAQANADIARMVPIWMDSWSNGPGTNSRLYATWRITPALRPLQQEVVGNIGGVLWVVMGTMGTVMLIACANVANLLLVRAEARQQELAIRAALGAGWGRIVRELISESLTLGLIGGAIGVGFAYAALRFLVAHGPANLPRLNEVSMDTSSLAFSVAISVASGLFFGLIPALKYAGPRASIALGGSRTAGAPRSRRRAQDSLVVA